MATPRKTSKGKWRIEVTIDGTTHRRTFPLKKDALAWERQIRTDHRRGVFIPPDREREKVADRLDAWLELKSATVADKTYTLYELFVRKHIKPYVGRLTMQHLTVEPIERWLIDLEADTSSAVAYKAYQVMSSFLTSQRKYGYVARNWCEDVEAPKHTQREIVVLEPWELSAIVEELKGQSCHVRDEFGGFHRMPEDHPDWELRSGWAADVVLGLALIGCRFGDLAALRPENWDRINNRLNIWDEKSDKFRWVPVFPAVEGVLERSVARGGELLFMSDGRRGQSRLWPAFNADYLKPAVERAGVAKHVTPHVMRHTCASWLHKQGFDLVHVSAYLGHASTRVTEAIYVHLFEDDLPDMGAALDEMVRRERPDNVTDIRTASNDG